MGVDDGLAFALAQKMLSGPIAVSTVFGNVPVPIATRNALLFRELLGRTTSLPVYAGADRASDNFICDARHIHGEDGLGGATRLLRAALLEKASAAAVMPLGDSAPPTTKSITLIGIGPATNIPRLVSWYGRSAVARIVLMSGVFFDIGNISPAAEFNARCDPHALRQTLDLGVPTTLIPLDVCRKVQISRSAMERFRETDDSPLTELLADSHMHYMDFYRSWEGIDGCYPHDTIAVLAALEPRKFFHLRGEVTVDCAGSDRGRTTFKATASSHVEIVTGGELKWAREILATFLKGNSAWQQQVSRAQGGQAITGIA